MRQHRPNLCILLIYSHHFVLVSGRRKKTKHRRGSKMLASSANSAKVSRRLTEPPLHHNPLQSAQSGGERLCYPAVGVVDRAGGQRAALRLSTSSEDFPPVANSARVLLLNLRRQLVRLVRPGGAYEPAGYVPALGPAFYILIG